MKRFCSFIGRNPRA